MAGRSLWATNRALHRARGDFRNPHKKFVLRRRKKNWSFTPTTHAICGRPTPPYCTKPVRNRFAIHRLRLCWSKPKQICHSGPDNRRPWCRLWCLPRVCSPTRLHAAQATLLDCMPVYSASCENAVAGVRTTNQHAQRDAGACPPWVKAGLAKKRRASPSPLRNWEKKHTCTFGMLFQFSNFVVFRSVGCDAAPKNHCAFRTRSEGAAYPRHHDGQQGRGIRWMFAIPFRLSSAR